MIMFRSHFISLQFVFEHICESRFFSLLRRSAKIYVCSCVENIRRVAFHSVRSITFWVIIICNLILITRLIAAESTSLADTSWARREMII